MTVNIQKGISFQIETYIIDLGNKKYFLNFPLMCHLEREDGYYTITCAMLDIIGTGLTEAEAEANFNQEFDFIYTRFHELKDEKLSQRLLNIKKILKKASSESAEFQNPATIFSETNHPHNPSTSHPTQ